MELPFVLAKRHKTNMKYTWKHKGLKTTPEEFEEIYKRYIHASKCELCKKEFETSGDRCMDHSHITGKFRNVCCKKCNNQKKDNKKGCNNKTGELNICKIKHKGYKLGYCFQTIIHRNSKVIFRRFRTTLEDAIKDRDEFITAHPEIYS